MSIELKMNGAELAFAISSIKKCSEELIDRLSYAGGLLADEMEQEANQSDPEYVQNLESLVKELTDENAKLASAAIAKPQTNPAPKTNVVRMRKKRERTAKAEAPWGYKKDGTPKQRPGRKVA